MREISIARNHDHAPLRDVTANEIALAQDARLVILVHGSLFMGLAEVVHVALLSATAVDLGIER